MELQSINQLVNTNFDLENITVLSCEYQAGKVIEYKIGRKNNLLHIVTFGTREYLVYGERITVNAGEIILIPKGTAYKTWTPEVCKGTGICFDMTGADEVTLKKGVYVKAGSETISDEIKRMEARYISSPCAFVPLKAHLFNILYAFATNTASLADYELIKPALKYISEHFCDSEKVEVYARICNMSESYFRKKFVGCMGMTPVEYRNAHRFSLARHLYSEGKTLEEIAQITGFYDAGFFSKAYKKQTGTTLRRSIQLV